MSVTVVVAAEATRPLPEHLEDIVGGSHSSLGDEGRATLRNILQKYVNVFPALGELMTGLPGRSNMISKLKVPDQIGVGHIAWHQLVSGLNRAVLRRC